MPQPISQGPKRPVKEILDRIPAKYLKDLEKNPKIPACCKKAEDHDFELFKSDEAAQQPDILVLTCACGRRHIRMAGGAGRVS